jgi:hypothetical protein
MAKDTLLALARTMRSTADAIIHELEGEAAAQGPSPPPANYATVSAFAEQLNVSVNTVRGWVKLGLPTVTVGRVVRVRVREAREWLDKGSDRSMVRKLAILSARTQNHEQKAGLLAHLQREREALVPVLLSWRPAQRHPRPAPSDEGRAARSVGQRVRA